MHQFGQRSQDRLATVHPHLRAVMTRAIQNSPVDFTVLEGVRSVMRQRQLLLAGATKTMKSRHLPHASDGYSRAVDVAPFVDGQVRWDWPLFYPLAAHIHMIAKQMGQPIEWGGDWVTFKDGPHWQLPWKEYP